MREKGATLSFAAFDPLAATGTSTHRRKPRVHDFETAPKRIVIEIPPSGSIGPPRWRFVPRARRAPGVDNEGAWPRKVILCECVYHYHLVVWHADTYTCLYIQ